MTAHNSAKKDEIAKIVIMPGDPLRAKWIAENFLDNPKLVNEVRGMLAYTGEYKNKKITVMGHGMGIPSIGIYSYELFSDRFYDVDAIIRIGSCASWDENIKLGDVVVVKEAYSKSTFADMVGVETKNNLLYPTKKLLDIVLETAKNRKIKTVSTRAYSGDTFYSKDGYKEKVKYSGAKVAEMESFGLYANAITTKKDALCILTVSDNSITREAMNPIDRQTTFKNMVTLALESALTYYNK